MYFSKKCQASELGGVKYHYRVTRLYRGLTSELSQTYLTSNSQIMGNLMKSNIVVHVTNLSKTFCKTNNAMFCCCILTMKRMI